MNRREDLEAYIRLRLKEKRPDMKPSEVEVVVNTVLGLKFMRSPEAVDSFISASK